MKKKYSKYATVSIHSSEEYKGEVLGQKEKRVLTLNVVLKLFKGNIKKIMFYTLK